MELKAASLMLGVICILSILQSPLQANAMASKDLIEDICNRTANYRFCKKVLSADKEASRATTYKQIAPIAIKMAMADAKSSYNFAKRLLRKNSDKDLSSCANYFDDAYGSFRSGLIDLDADTSIANYAVKTATDSATWCSNVLSSSKLQVPSLAWKNTKIALFSNICDTITDRIQSDEINQKYGSYDSIPRSPSDLLALHKH